MPQQYGTNGTNSDGSCMNVNNQIWDPAAGGRPSIKLFPQYSSGAAMNELLSGADPSSDSLPSPRPAPDPKATPKAKSRAAAQPHELEVREELKRIYRDHCPEKSDTEVANILLKFAGREEELLRKVRTKYPPRGVVQTQPTSGVVSQCVRSDREAFSGSTMADLLGGGSRDKPVSCGGSGVKLPMTQQKHVPTSTMQLPKVVVAASSAPDEFVQAGLYRAAQEGNMKLVKLALESDGADVNGRNEKDDYLTALHYASRNGNFRMVEYLLQVKGIDSSMLDAKGTTAADVAHSKGIAELFGRADCRS